MDIVLSDLCFLSASVDIVVIVVVATKDVDTSMGNVVDWIPQTWSPRSSIPFGSYSIIVKLVVITMMILIVFVIAVVVVEEVAVMVVVTGSAVHYFTVGWRV